jgi:predicted Fe-Mo cluster-binding NifX family protein
MRVAIAVFDNRVSPVLDVARNLVVVACDGEGKLERRLVVLDERHPAARAKRIADLGVDVLICGALSWPLEAMLQAAGVRVIARICGRADEVFAAFLADRLTDATFAMPGCRGRPGRTGGRPGNGPRGRQGRQAGRGRRGCSGG